MNRREPLSTHIRPGTLADAAMITGFNLALALETEAKALDPQRVRDGVEAFLRDATHGLYFVAENGGRIIGQLALTYEWSDWRNGRFWWFQSVYVAPGFRGHGVFRKLSRHIAGLARADAGCCGLRLYVEEHNHGAKEAYARLGLKRAGYEVFELDFQAEPRAGR